MLFASHLAIQLSFNDLRYRLSQNFKKRIALQLNNSDDYFVISLNENKIFIDYTPLIKNFNKDLKNIQIEIILEK